MRCSVVEATGGGSQQRASIELSYLKVNYRCRREVWYWWIMYCSMFLGITKFKTNAP